MTDFCGDDRRGEHSLRHRIAGREIQDSKIHLQSWIQPKILHSHLYFPEFHGKCRSWTNKTRNAFSLMLLPLTFSASHIHTMGCLTSKEAAPVVASIIWRDEGNVVVNEQNQGRLLNAKD
jgi:hypothetical protein